MKVKNPSIPGPRQIPWVGNLLEFGSNPLRFVEQCAEKYGAVVRFSLERDRETYLLTKPEHIQYVLLHTQRKFKKGYHRDRILSLVLGNGLVTISSTSFPCPFLCQAIRD
ncbi:cytochrome P450 [Xylanibacillus composti]|uniref:Uncharacterized protein n=1 Tax=Xylanibacillus composti TaxID=1572762 RepID=A0A8J4H3W3_9BACL|nr:cytochrome P450 [Xylanibacillus composti]GIQ69061.1 hypothetical protein XYCOK13_18850 [Xylanibacillus composti]